MRYIKLILGLATIGALVGLVLAAVVAANSSPNDMVYIPLGELALWLSVTGVVLGGAIGVAGSIVWALWRWIALRYRHSASSLGVMRPSPGRKAA